MRYIMWNYLLPKDVVSAIWPLFVFMRHLGFWTYVTLNGSFKYVFVITGCVTSIIFFIFYIYSFIDQAIHIPYDKIFSEISVEILVTFFCIYPLLLCVLSTFALTFIYRIEIYSWFLQFAEIDKKISNTTTISHLKIRLYICVTIILTLMSVSLRTYLDHLSKSWSWAEIVRSMTYIYPYINVNIYAALFISGLYVLREYQKQANSILFHHGKLLRKQRKQSRKNLSKSCIKKIENQIKIPVELLLRIHSELSELFYKLNYYFNVANGFILFTISVILVIEIYYLILQYDRFYVGNYLPIRIVFWVCYIETMFLYTIHLAQSCILQVSKICFENKCIFKRFNIIKYIH